MQGPGQLDDAVLDRFFYLLTKHGTVPPRIVQRLQEIREGDRFRAKGRILEIMRREVGPDD